MGNHWKRWRAYIDELEEAMRLAGEDLAAVEATSAAEHDRLFWRRPQREAIAPQLVTLAQDIPFLRDLVLEAARLGSRAGAAIPPGELTPWPERESRHEILSSERDTYGVQLATQRENGKDSTKTDEDGSSAPARLRNAERALAHRTRHLTVVLEKLSSPRNASAIVRSAEALGLQEVHFIDPRGKVKLNPATTRMCQRWLDLVWHRDAGAAIEELHGRGYTVVAADFGETSVPLEELPLSSKIAVVLGSEQEGVSRTVREKADALFHLPTLGFTSYLNVSVTAGIALYQLDRRMRNEGLRAPLATEERVALRQAWYALLAGEKEERRREYAAWLKTPPHPAPPLRPVPSREKRRELAEEPAKAGRGPAARDETRPRETSAQDRTRDGNTSTQDETRSEETSTWDRTRDELGGRGSSE